MDSKIFRSILEGAFEPIFIQTEEKFYWLNQSACRIFGVKASEELTGKFIMEQIPVSVVITDIKGHIEYVNPVFNKITGYSLEELNGKTLRILKSGYQSPEFYKDLWTTILAGKDWSGELINKKKSGQIYW